MNSFIFDVDGVIANFKQMQLREEKIVSFIVSELENDIPLIFVTGRSLVSLKEDILSKIDHKMSKPEKLDNLLSLGEFGADVLSFVDGKENIDTENISLPSDFVSAVESITNEYSNLMFTNKTKKTHYTSQALPNVDLEKDYKPAQNEVVEKYKDLLDQFELNDKYEILKDSVAINIRSIKTNKSYATGKALEWLKIRNKHIDSFTVFGDSVSDLEMGEELFRQKLSFKFVYVGKEEELPKDIPFPLHVTKEKFEKGTLEYLNSL